MEYLNNPQALLPFGIAALIKLTILILFCRTQVKTLSLIEPENKTIQPWLIWLLVIFENILSFFVVIGMSKSISNELRSRNFEEEKNSALTPGLLYAVLGLVSFLILALEFNGVTIPSSLTALIAVIGFSQIFFMVQYWTKIAWYKKILENDDFENSGNQDQEQEEQEEE